MKHINRLDILQALDKREALDQNHKQELYQLELGHIGEERIMKWVKEYGEPHWTVMQNIWLSHYGTFECDVILFTDQKIYLFEIKNYSKKFDLKNGQCYLGGKKIGHNPISQAQKVFVNFQQLMRNSYYQIPIETAVVFAGEHCEVCVHDEIQDIKILQLNQVRDYIWKIATDEKLYYGDPIDVHRVQRILEKNKGENYYLPNPISPEMENRIRKGIMCNQCGNFDIDPSKAIISCSRCLMREPRENAIVRTICEYGVIHFEKDLETIKLVNFFNGQVSRNNLYYYLDKHFEKIGRTRTIVFRNLTMPFSDCYKNLCLEQSHCLMVKDY